MTFEEIIKFKLSEICENPYILDNSLKALLRGLLKEIEMINLPLPEQKIIAISFREYAHKVENLDPSYMKLFFLDSYIFQDDLKKFAKKIHDYKLDVVNKFLQMSESEKLEFCKIFIQNIYYPSIFKLPIYYYTKWLENLHNEIVKFMSSLESEPKISLLKYSIEHVKVIDLTTEEMCMVIQKYKGKRADLLKFIESNSNQVKINFLSVVLDGYDVLYQKYEEKYGNITENDIVKTFKINPELIFIKNYINTASDSDIDNALSINPENIVKLPADKITKDRVLKCLYQNPKIINLIGCKLNIYSIEIYYFVKKLLESKKEDMHTFLLIECEKELAIYLNKINEIKKSYELLLNNDEIYSQIDIIEKYK